MDTRGLEATLRTMAVEGDIEPFLQLFHSRVIKALGLKDLRQLSEKSVKLMLMTYISLSRVYHPLSEEELAQGYCDLFLAVSQQAPAARFAWLLELKYLPTGATPAQIEAAFSDAARQIERYSSDAALVSVLAGGKELKKGAMVFVGARKVLSRPWPADAPEAPPRSRRSPAKPRAAKASKRAATGAPRSRKKA